MLLHCLGGFELARQPHRADLLALGKDGQRDRACLAPTGEVLVQDQLARAIGADRAVGKDHDRRFEPFRAMHGHDAHLVAALARFAFQIAIAGIEPADEALQAGGMRAGIGIRRIEQFVDRIVRFAPQPRD